MLVFVYNVNVFIERRKVEVGEFLDVLGLVNKRFCFRYGENQYLVLNFYIQIDFIVYEFVWFLYYVYVYIDIEVEKKMVLRNVGKDIFIFYFFM